MFVCFFCFFLLLFLSFLFSTFRSYTMNYHFSNVLWLAICPSFQIVCPTFFVCSGTTPFVRSRSPLEKSVLKIGRSGHLANQLRRTASCGVLLHGASSSVLPPSKGDREINTHSRTLERFAGVGTMFSVIKTRVLQVAITQHCHSKTHANTHHTTAQNTPILLPLTRCNKYIPLH